MEGLLEFWDELRQRHPQLILDIVQRGDLESISRGVDLTRADYPIRRMRIRSETSSATQGLSYWRPHYGTVLRFGPHNAIISAAALLPDWRSHCSMSQERKIR